MLAKTLTWTAVGVAVALGVRRTSRALAHASPITATVTINKPPREVYDRFRDFARLPEFMTYLERVEVDGDESTWTAHLPGLGRVSWRAKIADDVPGQLLVWQSLPGSIVQTRGHVTFSRAPGRDATEVRVEMQLGIGARPSSLVARLFAAPQVKGDLRRFKQVVETGEVVRSDASIHLLPHAAQPAEEVKVAS
jgi:uncharacterized membrane protein